MCTSTHASTLTSTTTSAQHRPTVKPADLPGPTASSLRSLAQRIDEAAILFATGQDDAAACLLHDALALPLPQPTELENLAWHMLLALHEATGRQSDFDHVALAYAQRFETSPPQWRLVNDVADAADATDATLHVGARIGADRSSDIAPAPSKAAAHAATVPAVLALRGRLDVSVTSSLARWPQSPASGPATDAGADITLDLTAVSSVDLDGCRALLNLLEDWRRQQRPVRLRPCERLLQGLRELIKAGRRDADDAGWLLLIELLRVAGDVERYEDACLAYSLTYEMSPPAAPAPMPVRAPGPASAAAWMPSPMPHSASSPAFTLPEHIALPVAALLARLRAHAGQVLAKEPAQKPAPAPALLVLDASRLQRVAFHAAHPLLAGIAQLAGGKPVEWREVSVLVSTLLMLTAGDVAPRIINRKP